MYSNLPVYLYNYYVSYYYSSGVYNANSKSYLSLKAYILGLVTSVLQYNNSVQCKHRIGLGHIIPNLDILVHRHFLKIVFC